MTRWQGGGGHPHGWLPEPERRQGMTWAQRLKRVFRVDIETWEHCGGAGRIFVSIDDPAVVEKILAHTERRDVAALGPFEKETLIGCWTTARGNRYGCHG